MRILIACEYSGVVREAFRAKGHEAMSCDILPSDQEGPHYQGNILDVLYGSWDMLIGFPPCTYLTCANSRNWQRYREEQIKAYELFLRLYNAPIDRIAIENPTGILNTAFRKPDQIINPFMFGHKERKRTCLWLKGLPPLMSTINVINAEDFVLHCSSKDRGKKRSRTFEGVASAMAEQWSI